MRPEWDHDLFGSALLAAKNAGWTWTRTFTEAARMLTDQTATPWDLKRAAASPAERDYPEPGTEKRGAAIARELLEHRHDPEDAA